MIIREVRAFLPQPYEMQVADSKVSGAASLNKFGRNLDVDTAEEDIWSRGGTWAAPTQARVHDIASSSTDDDGSPAGTGAHTVTVYGLNGSYVETSESVTLNGTTNVATTNSYVIIHRMLVTAAGSGGVNAGTITATAQTDATVTAEIPIGANQTLMAIWQVPVSKTLFLYNYYASANGTTANHADIRLLVKPFGQVWQLKHIMGVDTEGTGILQKSFWPPFKIEAKSLVKISAIAGAINLDISAGFDGVYREA